MKVLLTIVAAASASTAVLPEFKPVEARSKLNIPLFSFLCDATKPDALGDRWASVEVALTDSSNLFGLNRRPDTGKLRTPRIDDRIVQFASMKHEDRSASVFFKPDVRYGVQFELKLAPPSNPPGNLDSHNVSGVLSRTDGSAQRACMLVPNFSPLGSNS